MPTATPRLDRVLCLEESVWTEKVGLVDQTSVLPTLELLERLGTLDAFVHRHVLGETEFTNYMSWRTGKLKTYGTVYLAFHGHSKRLSVGAGEYTLPQLSECIGDLPGGVVHLGSCSVLKSNKKAAQQFLDDTGARLISGYERDVEWLDSAALDTAWLGYVAGYARLGDALRYFKARYASTIEYLKWQAFTTTG